MLLKCFLANQFCSLALNFMELGKQLLFFLISGKICGIGFYGFQPNCTKCPFPTYGLECQSICVCLKKNCNHVTGCSASMPDTGIFFNVSA